MMQKNIQNFFSAQLNHESSHDLYQTPLVTRYASREMSAIFSEKVKFTTWRKIWIALARAQKECGLPITKEQLNEMVQYSCIINFEKADSYERQFKHDVMAHIHAFGDQCPSAKSIIHLGATSCVVTDNADIITMRNGLHLIKNKLVHFIEKLSDKAVQYKAMPCLAYTHFQAAQPTTVGKRFTLWLYDFVIDFHDLKNRIDELALLGLKGATGTQASFLQLFAGNHEKVEQCENLFASYLNFTKVIPISGQTYARKHDKRIFDVLTGIAVSAHKMATDLRLLAHLKEMEESFDQKQVGSSAMPYKQNPIRSERICSIARYAISLAENSSYTAATQWLERSLDDSANRRLCIPELFLSIDAILMLLISIIDTMQIHEKIITQNLTHEMPFLSTEALLMACVQKGFDRQLIHEKIKVHALATTHELKQGSRKNNLINRLAEDQEFPLTKQELEEIYATQSITGRAENQVDYFIKNHVKSLLEQDIAIETSSAILY